MNNQQDLKSLIARLKVDEYDDIDILQTWATLEQQEKELSVLRSFANALHQYYSSPYRINETFNKLALEHNLIDSEGNPTTLLIGEKDESM